MSSLLDTLGINRLTPGERLRFVEEIWDSLGAEATDVLPTETQKQELDRRCAAVDADPDAVTPWEPMEAKALERLGG